MLTLVENQVRLHNVTRKGNYSEKPGAIHVPLKWERLKHAIDVIRCAGKGNVENSYVCILEGWTFHPSSVENVLRLSLWREIGGPTFFFFSFTYTLHKVLLRSDKLCTVGLQHRRAKVFSHHLESKEYVWGCSSFLSLFFFKGKKQCFFMEATYGSNF